MKIREGYISNSSSTSFIIKNIGKETKTLVDFVIENPQLVDEFNREYDCDIKLDDLVLSAEVRMARIRRKDHYTLKPNQDKIWIFGDEQKDAVGCVYDYILRDGGRSKNFEWRFFRYNR